MSQQCKRIMFHKPRDSAREGGERNVIREEQQRILSWFMSAGADVNASLPSNEYTPLMFAVMRVNNPCLKILLDAGAAPFVRNNRGRTAHDLAAIIGQPTTVLNALPHLAPPALTVWRHIGHTEAIDLLRQVIAQKGLAELSV
ncbi:uncharacterized protein MONBRDRAFT_24027 [Monosiga brevicollis MX1]|uniref:Ankyrin repeat domain-containing protein n=1 Tax=Monosiga brevicollis TaxID=81824 RepID=A9UUH5_MONBE|nr:uncharacterized protein MONBRDRAFT_24027 [Monosiga brevicollis MX1]EDQ91098.1 predicted protein [Monosiga brevicollis MX1]|eukprot:XP_001744395.1 hypothetical protein [Monosiga brevicollis MX1]